MLAMDQEVPDIPKYPSEKVQQLRIDLVEEEVTELLRVLYRVLRKVRLGGFVAHGEKLTNLVDIADAVADCIYVISGTATAFGIDAEQVFEIVHAANMRKTEGPTRIDGKRLKPLGWQPPEPQITDLITNAWANAAPVPVEQRDGIEWEGPTHAG